MKHLLAIPLIVFLIAGDALAQGSLPANQFATLTHEHTDGLCVLYNAANSPALSLVAWQRDAGLDLPTNQVVFVVKEEARLALPPGTPFGDAGAPFWILPQSQNPNLLYLGINVERVPSGVFAGPVSIQLKRLDGPGYFMVWQATGPGQYNIRINTRDGVSASDSFQPLAGAHEHFNWGFSTTGIYCATFQAVGQRLGESTNIFSAESTFVFQVLPLPPPTNFLAWQKTFWPPGFNPPATLTSGNPDGDVFLSVHEYAFHLSPTNADPLASAPLFLFASDGGLRYCALSFTRFIPALDLNYVPESAGALPGSWMPMTNPFSVVAAPDGLTERVTMRDTLPATNGQRFYRLRVELR